MSTEKPKCGLCGGSMADHGDDSARCRGDFVSTEPTPLSDEEDARLLVFKSRYMLDAEFHAAAYAYVTHAEATISSLREQLAGSIRPDDFDDVAAQRRHYRTVAQARLRTIERIGAERDAALALLREAREAAASLIDRIDAALAFTTP